MKTIIISTLAIIALAQALPQQPPGQAQILRYDSDNTGLGGYSFSYETSNGIQQSEVGQLKNEGKSDELLTVSGSYSYLGSDGNDYKVEYTADENGFQPVGAHLPLNGVTRKLGLPINALSALYG